MGGTRTVTGDAPSDVRAHVGAGSATSSAFGREPSDLGTSRARVLVIDRERSVAEAIAALVETNRRGCLAHACCSARHALETLDAGTRFDLILAELALPDGRGASGTEWLDALGARSPGVPIVLMSASDEDDVAPVPHDERVSGVVSKALPFTSFLARIDEVLAAREAPRRKAGTTARRDDPGRPPPAAPPMDGPGTSGLDGRQREVLRLVASGHSNRRIGALLGIAESTVRSRVHRLFDAFGVRNRTACLRQAERLGLMEADFGRGLAAHDAPRTSVGASPSTICELHPAEPAGELGRRARASSATLDRTPTDRGSDLIDAPSRRTYDDLVRVAAALLSTPVALITIVDPPRDRQCFLAQVGVREPWATRRQTPLSHSFCRHAVALGAVFAVRDARRHPTVRNNLAIEELGVTAYLGVPVHALEGGALGALCVIDVRPRHWTDDDVAALERLARCASDAMALHAALLASEAMLVERPTPSGPPLGR